MISVLGAEKLSLVEIEAILAASESVRFASLVNPRDRSLFFFGHILRDREVPQCGGLPLGRAHHPQQKTRERIPFGLVRNMRRNDNPGKGADWVNACTRSIHDGNLEVMPNIRRMASSGSDAFQTGWDELAITIANSAVAQVIL